MLSDPSTETSADEIAKPQWNLAEGTNDDDRNDLTAYRSKRI